MYDSVTDCWINAHVSSKNALEEVQFLEGSLAVQINEDQIYVFGGRNSNKYLPCDADVPQILRSF